jgi:hypothetical protein
MALSIEMYSIERPIIGLAQLNNTAAKAHSHKTK